MFHNAFRLARLGMALPLLGFSSPSVHAQEPAEGLRPMTVNPLDKSGLRSNLNLFNPAFGMVLDAVHSTTRNNRSHFDLRSAELNVTAAVDPFATLYAVFNGTSDGVEVEEAAFITTSLPANLTVRGGRFFANFGRLPHWHPHEYPVVEGFQSIEAFVGGESQGDGLELIHLFKTPFFLQGTLGAYNKIGAENERLEGADPDPGHTRGRPWQAMTYLGRLLTYVPLTDTIGIDLGASHAMTPRQYYIDRVRVDGMNTQRHLTGVDLTFRREPTGAEQSGRLLWGTEFFRNDERIGEDTDADDVADSFERKHAAGGYSYLDYRFARRWSGGGFADYAETLANRRENEKHYGAMLNFMPSEFQRVRLQYAQAKTNDGSRTDHQVFLQWFGAIGAHVHLFKDR